MAAQDRYEAADVHYENYQSATTPGDAQRLRDASITADDDGDSHMNMVYAFTSVGIAAAGFGVYLLVTTHTFLNQGRLLRRAIQFRSYRF